MNQFDIYSRMPVGIQNWLCSVKGAKLQKERYGGRFQEFFDKLVESDNWTADQILAYKEENIARMLDHAYNHSAFYKKFFDGHNVKPADFKELADLQKFPVLTKEMVRANWKGMIADNFRLKDLMPSCTSGSTGKALDFYLTPEQWKLYWAIVWRGRHRFGFELGDLHFSLTGKLVVPIDQKEPPYWRYNKPLNQYMINLQQLTPSKIHDIVDFINLKSPKVIGGYPSIITTLSNLIVENNLHIDNPPKMITLSSEKTYDMQRERIAVAFPGSYILEHYGSNETAISASMASDNYYHEDFELGHMELIDTTVKGNDTTGKVVGTSFHNYGMPFIRYLIGDTATFSSEKGCIASQVIKDIEGRHGDDIITPEGNRTQRFGYIFKHMDTIKECQIVQNELGSIVIRIVKRPEYSIKTEQDLRAAVKQWISPTLKVNFEYVNEIPRTKAGKFKAVISNIHQNTNSQMFTPPPHL